MESSNKKGWFYRLIKYRIFGLKMMLTENFEDKHYPFNVENAQNII